MAKKAVKTIEKITDLTPDPRNANRGTQRGLAALETSLEKYGAGRSILADKSGVVIAGNKTLQTAADKGFPIRVVQTDGKELVVVQRTDLDLAKDKAAIELGLADNRVAEQDLEWDASVLNGFADEGVDLSQFWNDDELAALLHVENPLVYGDGERGKTPTDQLDIFLNATIKQIVLYFQNAEYDDIIGRLHRILQSTGLTNHTAVFLKLLEHYENTAM